MLRAFTVLFQLVFFFCFFFRRFFFHSNTLIIGQIILKCNFLESKGGQQGLHHYYITWLHYLHTKWSYIFAQVAESSRYSFSMNVCICFLIIVGFGANHL